MYESNTCRCALSGFTGRTHTLGRLHKRSDRPCLAHRSFTRACDQLWIDILERGRSFRRERRRVLSHRRARHIWIREGNSFAVGRAEPVFPQSLARGPRGRYWGTFSGHCAGFSNKHSISRSFSFHALNRCSSSELPVARGFHQQIVFGGARVTVVDFWLGPCESHLWCEIGGDEGRGASVTVSPTTR